MYKIQLLVDVGKYDNNQMYPIVFAIVQIVTDNSMEKQNCSVISSILI